MRVNFLWSIKIAFPGIPGKAYSYKNADYTNAGKVWETKLSSGPVYTDQNGLEVSQTTLRRVYYSPEELSFFATRIL